MTLKKYETIKVEKEDGITWVIFNRPDKRNAMSPQLHLDMDDVLDELALDDETDILIVTGAGPAFSAGHDLRELVDGREAEYTALFALCTDVMEAIRTLPKPVIAQVHAIATAAGCQLAASCDLVVASEDATFATPGVRIGLFCTTPGVALARAVGPKKAMEMLLTGQPIGAREAEQAGLVNRVVPADRLADETMALARQIITASAYTLGIGKRAFYEQLPLDRPRAYEIASRVMVENALAPDGQEGMKAFLEKRPPKWRPPAT